MLQENAPRGGREGKVAMMFHTSVQFLAQLIISESSGNLTELMILNFDPFPLWGARQRWQGDTEM